MRVIDKTWNVTGELIPRKPVWFNDGDPLPAGYYTLKYVGGAFKLGGQNGWAVSNDWKLVSAVTGGFVDVYRAPSNDIPGPPSLPNAVFRGFGYDSQEAAENASKTATNKFFYYPGGVLGITSYRDDYIELTAGDPNPTWQLIHYADSSTGSIPGSGTSTPPVESATAPTEPPIISGLLSPEMKLLIDSLPSHPGGFGFIFRPGTYLTPDAGPDSILTGDVELRSNTFDITCIRGINGDVSRNVFKFTLSNDFLDAFCLNINGEKGQTGDKGPKGGQGRHGTGDGPKGAQGERGKDAVKPDKLTGVKIIDNNEIHDTAVVDLLLDPQNCVLEVVKAKMAVPESDEPATRVTATAIYRDIQFRDSTLNSWDLVSPDPSGPADLDIIKLPSGWSGQVEGAVPITTMKLSELIKLVVDYYQSKANTIITEWDREIREYIIQKDKEARQILADLAMELTECEWSSPVEFCIDIQPIECA